MPSYRWTRLIAVIGSVGGACWGTPALAFQYPPLSDEINTRNIHGPDDWVGGGFQSSGNINQSPAEFGPAPGMWQRSSDGYPASGDSFPLMTPGPLPGGLSPYGFNSSGLNPPVNQPAFIANNPAFGGNGQSSGNNMSNGFGPNAASPNGQNLANGWNQNQSGNPYGVSQMSGAPPRQQPKMSWALESSQQPYVGLLGQIARPGVYEIEKQGSMLGDLIQVTGGLAKDASGQFRIIRNGRPGQMASYAGAAKFELMAGDLIIADAQVGTSSNMSQQTNAKPASAGAVQIGFVNLIDRPVVLKLRREHASVVEILALMRQDENLASQIKVIAPPNQRSMQARLDVPLPSETVLIFAPNTVRAARLAPLPEPFMIKRDTDDDRSSPSGDATQQPAPRANITPDVTQSPRRQPSQGTWQDSTPLPSSARPVTQPRTTQSIEVEEAPPPLAEVSPTKRPGGVRGSPRAQDRIARDTNMVLAPPADAQENEPAPVPEPIVSDDQPNEPSLLNPGTKRRPIRTAEENTTLSVADIEEPNSATEQAGSSWSIWPPVLTAAAGLLSLIGFSLWLRRRTQAIAQSLPTPMPTIQTTHPVIRHPHPSPRQDLLDAIIDDQLPLSREELPLASPMQFHGRPQPPRTIRLDQGHALPKPHSPSIVSADTRAQESEVHRPQVAAPKFATTATQKFRIDRSGATGTAAMTASIPAASQHQPTSGPLDRALSNVQRQSVQKQGLQKQTTPTREERGA